MDEIFEIVDENNNIIGTALRSECHGNPNLIHRTSHVIVMDSKDRILLQKRSMNKDIQPGKWDTAVGGHLMPGESFEDAAKREMHEELGISSTSVSLKYMFNLRIRNDIESENTEVYMILYSGPFNFQKQEIDEIRFWTKSELLDLFGKDILTPICEKELKTLFSG